MMEQQENMLIPSTLIPICPYYKKPLTMNLRADNKFVEDKGWYEASNRYTNFLNEKNGQKILFLELGVGYNTPSIIKYPFWQMTANNPNAFYVCINFGEAICPKEIESQSICINTDIFELINSLIQ